MEFGQNDRNFRHINEKTKMDFTPDRLADLSALGTILAVFLFGVWRGVPALIAYLDRKDALHRDDTIKIVEAHRLEREAFYKDLGIKLDKISDRLDHLESSITNVKTSIIKKASLPKSVGEFWFW